MFTIHAFRFFTLHLGIFFMLFAAIPGFSAENRNNPPGDQDKSGQGSGNTYELIAAFGDTRKDASKALDFLDQAKHIVRYREVVLAEALTSAGELAAKDHLVLNLFEDRKNNLVDVRRVDTNVNGSFTVAARAPEGGVYVALSTTKERTLGTIFIPKKDQFFKIISDPSGARHYLLEMRASDRDIIEGGPPLIPEPSPDDIREQERIRNHLKEHQKGPEDMARIGVMVVYTPQARQWALLNGGGIHNVVALAMVNAQMTLENSKTRVVMELVHSGQVNHTESGSSSADLGNLTEGTGNLAMAHNWRATHGADLVAMFAKVSDVGGLAWLLNSRHGSPTHGFSLTRVQQAANGFTHIHEMGHNMGLHHHAQQNFQPGPTDWTNWPDNQWSAGWRWTGETGGRFCSVMTYTSGQYFADGNDHTQVPYFSNPNITHSGVSTGHAEQADNARTVREIKHVIAAYQPTTGVILVTNETDNIRAFNAITGGTILDDDGQSVSQRGIVWNTTGDPLIDDNEGRIEKGPGESAYQVKLTNLEPANTYYVRAYARTSTQVHYGNTRQFKTKSALSPEVDSGEPDIIAHNFAETSGNVGFDGNTEVTARGVVWSTQPNPTINNNDGMSHDGAGEGAFTSQITDLQTETQYHYRAYATNFTDTSYGEEKTFTTLLARVFPNPASDVLHLAFHSQDEEELLIRLITPEGQVAKKRTVQGSKQYQESFQVKHLRAGMYYLEVRGAEHLPVWPVMISPKR